jgi:hypothetical protein
MANGLFKRYKKITKKYVRKSSKALIQLLDMIKNKNSMQPSACKYRLLYYKYKY